MVRTICSTFTVAAMLSTLAGGSAVAQALLQSRDVGGVLVLPIPAQPGVAYATSSMECGGTKYEVSTGNSAGSCTSNFGSDGNVESVTCNDGAGNSATAHCSTGANGCGNTSGAGSCKFAK